MKAIFFLIIISSLFMFIHLNTFLEEDKIIIMNIYYSKGNQKYTTKISNTRDDNAVASALYNKSYEETGLDFLSISTYEKSDQKYSDEIKSYAMGYLEDVLTKDRFYQYYNNILNNTFHDEKIPENFLSFFKIKLEYMEKIEQKNMGSDS